MRQFGLDLRRSRPTWRRWRPRFRMGDLCELVELYFPEFFDLLCGDPALGFGPGRRRGRVLRVPLEEEGEPELVALARTIGGLTCPGVFTQQGFSVIAEFDVNQLRVQGVTIPELGQYAWSDVGGNLWFLFRPNLLSARVKSCFGGPANPAERVDFIRRMNALTPGQLESLGLI